MDKLRIPSIINRNWLVLFDEEKLYFIDPLRNKFFITENQTTIKKEIFLDYLTFKEIYFLCLLTNYSNASHASNKNSI